MSLSSPPRRHSTLKIALCVCNAITACELGFVAVFLALFALFDKSGDVNVGYIPFVAVAGLLAITGAVLAKFVWRERIGTTVFNLVYSLFIAAAAIIIMTSNRFRLLFCVMGVAPLAGCCLSLRYLSLLRRDKRERERGYYEGSAASIDEHWEDEATTAYAHDVTLSPTASPRSISPNRC